MKIAVNEIKTTVWIRPENKSKYACNIASGIGARKISFQPLGTKLKIAAEASLKENSTMVNNAQPAIALPNKRNVSESKGAHMDNKLTGKNTGNGST